MGSRWDNTLFFLGRHGRTHSNDLNIYRSWSNSANAQLEPKGQEEVRASAEWLAAQRAPIELIISDSLDRTLETSEIYAEVLGVERIVAVRGLHPLNMGDWTGKNKERYSVEPFLVNKSKRIPGGERVKDFDQRQFAMFKIIMPVVDSLPPGAVLIVGHGSTVSFLWNNVFNKDGRQIGYEGLVDPAGLVNVTKEEMIPVLRARERKGAKVEEK